MVKKNEHTCRWRVDFKELAYDGGGSASWTQYYFTKIGALISKFRNLYITSWGGKATLIDTEKEWLPHEVVALEEELEHARAFVGRDSRPFELRDEL